MDERSGVVIQDVSNNQIVLEAENENQIVLEAEDENQIVLEAQDEDAQIILQAELQQYPKTCGLILGITKPVNLD